MKKRSDWLLGLFIALIVLSCAKCIIGLFCNKVPEGHVVVPQATVDSLKAYIVLADSLEKIANQPPDTIVVHDTIYLDTTKTTTTTPHQTEVDSVTTKVQDSLKVQNEIDVSIAFNVKAKGPVEITPIQWNYRPVIQKIETTIEVPKPYPVIENVYINKQVNGHYLSLGAGGNDKLFNFGVDYDYVSGERIYGLQYRRYGDMNVFGVKVGINLNTLFKRNR